MASCAKPCGLDGCADGCLKDRLDDLHERLTEIETFLEDFEEVDPVEDALWGVSGHTCQCAHCRQES